MKEFKKDDIVRVIGSQHIRHYYKIDEIVTVIGKMDDFLDKPIYACVNSYGMKQTLHKKDLCKI